MVSKIYIAIILSDYQETNLKRFVDHFQIKDQIVLIRNYNYKNYKNKINIPRFPKNVKRKSFYNKYFFLAYFLFILLKNSLYKKKFIFGNPKSKFGTFLRKFINGKNQFYLDDGFETIHYDFNKLKKNSTVFTLYNIRLPSKIINIRFLPKLIKKEKKNAI